MTDKELQELIRQAQEKPEIKQLNEEIKQLSMIRDILEGNSDKWHIKPAK